MRIYSPSIKRIVIGHEISILIDDDETLPVATEESTAHWALTRRGADARAKRIIRRLRQQDDRDEAETEFSA